jgi:catalase
MLVNLANVSTDLTERVAANLGMKPPRAKPTAKVTLSPALSLLPSEPGPVAGRVVGVFAADGVDGTGLAQMTKMLTSAGIVVRVIAPHGGTITSDQGPIAVTKSMLTTQSVEYDALVVAGGEGAEASLLDPYIAVNLTEAYRHYKPIAAWGAGVKVIEAAGVDVDAPGVVTGKTPTRTFSADLTEAIGWHRYWERDDWTDGD